MPPGAFVPPSGTDPADGEFCAVQVLSTLKRNPLECWSADCFREPIVRVKLPFGDALLVPDPAAIEHVLVDNAANYRRDPIQRRILATGLADGLLSVEGARWEVQRRNAAPLFARRTVASLTDAMLAAADLLSERWRRLMPYGTLDVAAELTLLTLNVLALTIFSDGIGDDLDEFRTAMNTYVTTLGRIGALDLFGVPISFRGRDVSGSGARWLIAKAPSTGSSLSARRLDGLGEAHAPADLLTPLLRAPIPRPGGR